MLAVVLTGCWKDYDVEPNPLQVSHAEVYRVGSKLFAGVTFKTPIGHARFTDMQLYYEQNGHRIPAHEFATYNPLTNGTYNVDTTACIFLLYEADTDKSIRLTELYAISGSYSRSQNLFSLMDQQQLTFAPSDFREAPVSVSLKLTPSLGACAWSLVINSPIRNLMRARTYIFCKSNDKTTSWNQTLEQSGTLHLAAGEYDIYAEVVLYIDTEEVLTLMTPHQIVTIP